MRAEHLRVLAFAVCLGVAAVPSGNWHNTGGAIAAEETPPDVLAAHLRLQGHSCDKAQTAERDAQRSKPDSPVWIVTCETATYRVQLVPHMAARVERVEPGQKAGE